MDKVQLECQECGEVFKRAAKKDMFEVKCPQCNGYDVEVNEFAKGVDQ